MGKLDYRLIVRVLKDWRVTIPDEIRVKAGLQIGELLLAGWNAAAEQVTLTRLAVETVGGTVVG